MCKNSDAELDRLQEKAIALYLISVGMSHVLDQLTIQLSQEKKVKKLAILQLKYASVVVHTTMRQLDDVANVMQNLLSQPCMKVQYYTDLQMFTEYVMFEHSGGIVRKRARDWWRQVHKTNPPETTAKALEYSSQLRPPRKIRVWVNKKWPEVLSREF